MSFRHPQLKFIIIVLLFLASSSCGAQDTQQQNSPQNQQPQQSQQNASSQQNAPANTQPQETEVAGVFFGQPVPMQNYNFVLMTVLRFDTPWGGVPSTPEQLEERVWDDLLLSYESFRRDIKVSREETEKEIEDTLSNSKVSFNWRQDKEAYEKWAKETLGEPTELFENQMQHLVQLKKLRQQVMDGINPNVTEQEALDEYIKEYNTLSVELIQFDELKDAQEFYDKVKADATLWDKAVESDKQKEKQDQKVKRPGFVSTEFLIEMWKFPKADVEQMVKMKVGEFYKPAPVYKGYGVFKILETRPAVIEEFPQKKEYYLGELRMEQKYRGFWRWMKGLRTEGNLQIFKKPPEGIFKPVEADTAAQESAQKK